MSAPGLRGDLSIRQRLGIGFTVVVLILLTQMGFSFLQARSIQAQTDRLVEVIEPQEALARDVRIAYLNQAIALRAYALTKNPTDLQMYRDAVARGDRALSTLDRRDLDDEERGLIAEARPSTVRYATLAEAFVAAGARGSAAEIATLEVQLADVRTALVRPLDAFVALQQERATAARAEIAAARDASFRTQVWMSVVMVLAVLVTGWVTTRAVRDPAMRLVETARAIGAGDYAPALAIPAPPNADGSPRRYRDELRELADTIRSMAGNIVSRETRLAAHARISGLVAADLDIGRLTGGALHEMMEFADCQVGVIYGADDDATVIMPLSAVGLDVSALETLAVGQGIPGRAAGGRQTVLVSDIPADTPFQVGLGFDRVPPRSVLAVPMQVRERLIGVLLVASVRDLGPERVNFIEAAARQVAMSLQNAMAHEEIIVLASQLQDQNEELQAQNEEIQAQNEEIAQQAEEIQVQNEELQVQNEELDTQRLALIEADRHKDEFLSIAVHELRSPITGIKGSAQLMRRSVKGQPAFAEFDGKLETIDRLANTLVTRINRLLDVTRARTGELAIQPSAFDFVGLSRECVEEWRTRHDRREIAFNASVTALEGMWDRSGVQQILDNLIENALRYSPDGGAVIVAVDGHEDAVRLSVSDSGIGIPDEALPRLFDLYYRDPGATQVAAEGLGLGLYITKQLVDAHGGDIAVTTSVGVGTTFVVTLPRRASAGAMELVPAGE